MAGFIIEHIGIAADDPQTVAAWYAAVLGFREFYRTAATPPAVFLQDGSGTKIEVFPRKAGDNKPAFQDRTGIHFAIAVDDYEKAVAEFESRGVSFTGDTIEVFSGGKARFFSDPEGNRLHIVYRPAMPW